MGMVTNNSSGIRLDECNAGRVSGLVRTISLALAYRLLPIGRNSEVNNDDVAGSPHLLTARIKSTPYPYSQSSPSPLGTPVYGIYQSVQVFWFRLWQMSATVSSTWPAILQLDIKYKY